MRKVAFALAAVGALTVLAAAPPATQASWLSEALHSYFDRDDYGYYYYPPVDGSYPPGSYSYYYAPEYPAVPGYFYYGGPYYVPYRTYGYRPWAGHHEWHEWREHHGHR
jgi:hypothetical protein